MKPKRIDKISVKGSWSFGHVWAIYWTSAWVKSDGMKCIGWRLFIKPGAHAGWQGPLPRLLLSAYMSGKPCFETCWLLTDYKGKEKKTTAFRKSLSASEAEKDLRKFRIFESLSAVFKSLRCFIWRKANHLCVCAFVIIIFFLTFFLSSLSTAICPMAPKYHKLLAKDVWLLCLRLGKANHWQADLVPNPRFFSPPTFIVVTLSSTIEAVAFNLFQSYVQRSNDEKKTLSFLAVTAVWLLCSEPTLFLRELLISPLADMCVLSKHFTCWGTVWNRTLIEL